MKHQNTFVPFTANETTVATRKSKISWKIKILIICMLVLVSIVGLNAFFDRFYLVSPIQLQNPLRVRGSIYPVTISEPQLDQIIKEETDKVKSMLESTKPAVVEAKEPDTKSISWYIDKVWMKESTRGKNNVPGSLQAYCEARGEWNEYGYGGMAKKICFKDRVEADVTMNIWFTRELAQKNDAQTFCYYAYGKNQDNCDYYQDILAEN